MVGAPLIPIKYLYHGRCVRSTLIRQIYGTTSLDGHRLPSSHQTQNIYQNHDQDFNTDHPVSINSLGVRPTLCKALENEDIHVPTVFQYEALPVTLAHKNNCIIHSKHRQGRH